MHLILTTIWLINWLDSGFFFFQIQMELNVFVLLCCSSNDQSTFYTQILDANGVDDQNAVHDC